MKKYDTKVDNGRYWFIARLKKINPNIKIK